MSRPTRRAVLTAAALATTIAGLEPSARAAAGHRATLTLVAGRRPRVSVIWWGDAVTGFAAQEFADYVERMSGARLPVRQVKPAPGAVASNGIAAAAGRPSFRTLPSDWVTTHEARLAAAPADSFVSEVHPARLVLTGRTGRSVLYAAYAALEQLGARFFAPAFAYYEGAHEVLPRTSTIALGAQSPTTSSPSFALRRKDIEEGWSINDAALTALIDWMAKSRFTTLVFPYDYYGAGVTVYDDFRAVVAPELAKRGLTLELGGHGYNSFLKPEQYPQYYSSGYNVFHVENDEALTTYVDEVVSYLKDRPEVATFDCWPPDGASWAPETLAAYGSATNAEVHVVNTLVAAIAKAGLSVQVERIAYGAGLEPPTGDNAFDAGVLIDFAAYGRSYAAAIDDPSNATNASYYDVLKRWRAAHSGDLAIYDYSRRYRWREIGNPIDVLAADARAYAALDLTGVESYAEPGNWLQFEALHLFTARSAWNSSLSAGAYLSSYTASRFGAGAGAMTDYFRRTAAQLDDINATGGGAAFRAQYQAAAKDVATARRATRAGSAAALVLDRMASGCTLALADIGITAANQSGDPVAAADCADEYRRLTEKLRFQGVQLESSYVGNVYGHSVTRPQIAAEYRAPAWCYLPDWKPAGAAGSTVVLRIAAEPVDYAAHEVHWSLSLPAGVTASRTTGTLKVHTRSSDTTVKLSLDKHLAGGDHPIVLSFSVDGAEQITSNTATISTVYAALADTYDNIGVTDDGTQVPSLDGGLDGDGSTLSAQALAAVGIEAGKVFDHNGISYTWASASSGTPDNVMADGQTVAVSTTAGTLGLLFTGTYSKAGTPVTGTVNYTDGSTTSYTVVAPDWGYADPPASVDVAATMSYRNLGAGKVSKTTRLYAAPITVDQTKTVASLTLPRVSDHATGGMSSLHVFAIGTGS